MTSLKDFIKAYSESSSIEDFLEKDSSLPTLDTIKTELEGLSETAKQEVLELVATISLHIEQHITGLRLEQDKLKHQIDTVKKNAAACLAYMSAGNQRSDKNTE